MDWTTRSAPSVRGRKAAERAERAALPSASGSPSRSCRISGQAAATFPSEGGFMTRRLPLPNASKRAAKRSKPARRRGLQPRPAGECSRAQHFAVMTQKKILLIEDEESIADPLTAALRRDGFDVVRAGTAAEGREALRSRSPDLVLLDIMLPDGDGRDLLREIRNTSRIPVVMLTAP